MTKVITRYFESADQARSVQQRLLYEERFLARDMKVFDAPEGVAGTLEAAEVMPATAAAYAARMANGGAVLLVRAGYQPLNVARTTRTVTAEMGAVDMGDVVEEVQVKESKSESRGSILRGHPYMMSVKWRPGSNNYYMAEWPIPHISRRVPQRDLNILRDTFWADKPIGHLLPGSKRYGRWPFDLLIPGHKFMAKFPFGHIVPGHKFMAKFPFGHIVPGHKFMAKFPFAHIVPGHKFMAKFPFGHLVPGGRRMANFPFPLLINGKQHTNALVPGHKFMAKFPFAHLIPGHKLQAGFPFGHIVPGHKHMAKFPFAHIVPGHKFMAKFPFGHIVPGHKYMAKFPFGHIVPGHKYMANWILPHTKKAAS